MVNHELNINLDDYAHEIDVLKKYIELLNKSKQWRIDRGVEDLLMKEWSKELIAEFKLTFY